VDQEIDNLPAEAELHREIYRRYKEVGAVIHTLLPDILAVSRTGRKVMPLLDDFAQIIGTSVRVADYDGSDRATQDLTGKLKGRNAVMIRGRGALCTGPGKNDASAAVMVLDKGCKALICASLLGKVKPINFLEALLMRYIYLKKYSKQI
jgi:ribulose-5-phosphate 4-epimerase/fuculose-1-phosphate aldolase